MEEQLPTLGERTRGAAEAAGSPGREATHEIELENQEEAVKLLGRNGTLRKRIQAATQVRIVDRGAKIVVIGDPSGDDRIGGRPAAHVVGDLLEEMLVAVRRGHTPSLEDVDYALGEAGSADPQSRDLSGLGQVLAEAPPVLRTEMRIKPRTRGQKGYLDAVKGCPLTLAIGPAGTGKTYLAMACAVSSLMNREVNRLILTRPAVEAGESLGFLPGDLQQKVNPYLRPLYDALYAMVDMDKARRFIERESIEVAPLAFMRGRTLDNAFVILDEGQNTTREQMMMFLTRLGQNSRAIVTGDITQVDLPRGVRSGLVEAEEVLRDVEGVAIIHLTKQDVVRHPLVQRIVRAYEVYGASGRGGSAAGEDKGSAQ